MNVTAFLNSYSQGLSGGDACFLNNAKYIGKKDSLNIVTSSLGKELCEKAKIKANYVVTSEEKTFTNVIITYIKRTIRALSVKTNSWNDVIYASSDFIPDVLPSFILKKKNKENVWVQKVFHLIPKGRIIPYIFQQISLYLIKDADIVIVDNSDLKKDLEENYHLKAKKVFVIPPGVDVSYIKSIKQDKEQFDAIFVGQLRKSKGIFDIPEIWEEVTDKLPNAKLAIIGKNVGENQSQLDNLISNKNLSKNIKILGFQTTEKTFALLKSAKCLILPSYEEGFGMVILESLVCNTPVVSYDLPVFKEYFTGGVKSVEIADTKSFSTEVIKLINKNKKEDHENIYGKLDINNLVKTEYELILKNIHEK